MNPTYIAPVLLLIDPSIQGPSRAANFAWISYQYWAFYLYLGSSKFFFSFFFFGDCWHPDSIQASLKLIKLPICTESFGKKWFTASANRGRMQEKGWGGVGEDICNVWSCECKHRIFASPQITSTPMSVFTQEAIQSLLWVCSPLATPQPAPTAPCLWQSPLAWDWLYPVWMPVDAPIVPQRMGAVRLCPSARWMGGTRCSQVLAGH